MEIATLRTDAGDFDVLREIPARDGTRLRYDDLIDRADRRPFRGVDVTVANLEDIIASKEWADRPKDREALPELYQLLRRDVRDQHGKQPSPPALPPQEPRSPGR